MVAGEAELAATIVHAQLLGCCDQQVVTGDAADLTVFKYDPHGLKELGSGEVFHAEGWVGAHDRVAFASSWDGAVVGLLGGHAVVTDEALDAATVGVYEVVEVFDLFGQAEMAMVSSQPQQQHQQCGAGNGADHCHLPSRTPSVAVVRVPFICI